MVVVQPLPGGSARHPGELSLLRLSGGHCTREQASHTARASDNGETSPTVWISCWQTPERHFEAGRQTPWYPARCPPPGAPRPGHSAAGRLGR